MFQRYNNTKRGVALLGVILALLSSMESSHLFCQMGLCSVAEAAKPCDQHVDSETESCSHSKGCAASSELPAPNRQGCGIQNHQDGSCPCPPTCWCQQTPQPLELPKDSNSSAEILLLALSLSNTSVALSSDPAAKPGVNYLSGDSLHVTSTERCARLCRFLI